MEDNYLPKEPVYFPEVKSSFWDYGALILGKIGVVLLGLVSIALITRILGPEKYGRFSLFLMVAQFLMFALASWSSSAVIRFGKEEYIKENKINKVFWARTVILTFCFIFASLLILISRQPLISYIGIAPWMIWLVIAHFFIYSLSEFLHSIFQATNHLKTLALTEFFEFTVLVAGLILTKIFISSSLFVLAIVIGVYLLSKILVNSIFLFRLDLKIFFPIEIERAVIKRIFFFSYPLIFATIAGYVSSWVDIGVIKKYLDISRVGFYFLAFKIVNFLTYFGAILGTVFLPMMVGFLSRGRKDLIKLYTKRIIPQITFLWGIALFFVFIFSRPLIPVIFGKEFLPSILPFSILIIGSTARIFSHLHGTVLTTFELIKQITIINILMAGLNFGLDLLLVPLIGIEGAAIAKCLAFLFGGISYLFLTNHYLGLKEYKQLLIPLPFIMFFIVNILSPGLIYLIGGTIILVILMFLIAKYLDLVRQEDKKILEAIDMPIFLRKGIYKMIDKLSPVL